MKRLREDDALKLTKEQKTAAVELIKEYLLENFDVTSGNLKAEFLIDFISETIGKYYYNQAVADCMAFIKDRTDDLYLLIKDE